MKKIFSLTLISLSAISTGAYLSSATASEPTQVYIEIQSRELEGEQGLGKCSATAVSDRAYLTARHCLVGTSYAWVKVNDQQLSVTKMIADGSDHLLVITEPGTIKNWSRIGKPARLNQDVFIVGNPGPLRSILRRGYLAGTDPTAEASDAEDMGIKVNFKGATLYDLNGFFGDSGSGIFDKRNRLIGVVSYMRTYSLPGGYIKLMGALPFNFTDEQWEEAGVRR